MIIGGCNFADDVLYDLDSNTWVRFSDGGRATVGINTVLAWMGGRFTTVSFKKVGSVVEKGKSLGAVESVRHFETVKSPVSGTIIRINHLLERYPKILNSDPYSRGWFVEVDPSHAEERHLLRPASEAKPGLEAKISELKVRCFVEFPDQEMYEIGTECSAVLVRLNEFLASSPEGTVVHLVSDDQASAVEMVRWSEATGNQLLESRSEGNLMHYIVKKTQG